MELLVLKLKKVSSYVGIELSSHACNYAKNEFNLNVQNMNIYNF